MEANRIIEPRDREVADIFLRLTTLLMPRLYVTSSAFHFNADNVRHITVAVRNTMLRCRSYYAAIDTSEHEDRCFSQLIRLLNACDTDTELPIVVDVLLLNAFLERGVARATRIQCAHFALAVAGQMQLSATDGYFPVCSVTRGMPGASDEIVSRISNFPVWCDFSMTSVRPKYCWTYMCISLRLDGDKAGLFLTDVNMEVLPSAKNLIGLTRWPIGRPRSTNKLVDNDRPSYDYCIGLVLIDMLNVWRRVPLRLDDIYPALEENGDTPDTPDVDPPSGQNNTSDDSDVPTENTRPLIALNLELSKDETLNDLMYKIAVARFIMTKVIGDSGAMDVTIKALLIWKNRYMFLVSANETKKFLTKMKQQFKP